MKVAVVYNRDSRDVINLFGTPNREKIGLAQVKRITDALKSGGHQPKAFEADKQLVHRLEDFMPQVVSGERPGLVFNVSYGIQGQARYTHVPSILEMVGIPYVASGPLAHSLALDKVVTKMVLAQQGLPTPEFTVLEAPGFAPPDLPYPLIVKPKNEAVSFGIRVVQNEDELRKAADHIFDAFQQAVLAERYIEGREVNVGLLGNGPPEALPPVELSFGSEGPQVYRYEDKIGQSGRTIELVCPASLGEELTERAQALAVKAFSAIGCCDCARVDMRLDARGRLYILEINSLPALGPRGSYVRAAERVGLDFPKLVNRLVEIASARYFGTPDPPEVATKVGDPSTSVFEYLTQRRDRIERRIREWCLRSSRTGDPVGLSAVAAEMARLMKNLGLEPVPELTVPRAVSTWQSPAGLDGGTLLVGHLDAPLALEEPAHAFRREPEWLFGEGIATSRASVVMSHFALHALRSARALKRLPLGVLYYFDEGRNCEHSEEAIRSAMARAGQVLVLRPGGMGGHYYRRRRGERRFRLAVEGRPARPGKARVGPDVMRWFSQKVEPISSLSSREQRLSVSVVDVRTEAFPLLLPHRLVATLLITYADSQGADAIEAAIRETLGRERRWKLHRISDRPPVPARRANRQLGDSMTEIAKEWDIPFKGESSVWPSVAGLAPPDTAVICGVGPVGRDLYTPQEAVQRISVMQRTLLLAQFLLRQGE